MNFLKRLRERHSLGNIMNLRNFLQHADYLDFKTVCIDLGIPLIMDIYRKVAEEIKFTSKKEQLIELLRVLTMLCEHDETRQALFNEPDAAYWIL